MLQLCYNFEEDCRQPRLCENTKTMIQHNMLNKMARKGDRDTQTVSGSTSCQGLTSGSRAKVWSFPQ